MRATQNEQGMWTVCSQACRIHFMRRWVQLHVQECARLGVCARCCCYVLSPNIVIHIITIQRILDSPGPAWCNHSCVEHRAVNVMFRTQVIPR